MKVDAPADLAFAFGPFRFVPRRRLLLKDGSPLALGGRAMDLLLALVEHAGVVLSRKELESRAWPGLVVEETSLRVHVSALRRKLQDGLAGARYIANVPGRGYCFVAPVARVDLPSQSPGRADLGGADGSVRAPCTLEEALGMVGAASDLLASALQVLRASAMPQAPAQDGAGHEATAVSRTGPVH